MSERCRAAIYARYSSHSQRDESIEIQLEQCRAFCEERGLTVVEEYCDHATTGRNTNRAGFQRMLVDAVAKKFDHLVIYKVTRIMRDRDKMSVAREQLKKCGVDILYAGEQIGEGSSGVLQLGMMEVLAEWESALMSERIRDGIQKNAARGMANGHVMYGWDIVDGYYVVNESERAVLDKARRIIMAGGSVADATRALSGYRSTRGAKFRIQNLITMLRRPQNAGTYKYAGHVIEDGMPALWSKEEQMALEQKINSPGVRPKSYNSPDKYVLTGKLYHEHDGHLATYYGVSGTSKSGAKYRYYKCHECKKSIRADKLEREVADMVLLALEDEQTRHRIADAVCRYDAEHKPPDKVDAIQAELDDIQLRYARVWSAIEQGFAPPGGKARMDELKERQALLETELRVEKAKVRLVLNQDRVLFWLEKAARATAEQLIEMFVSRVIITEDGGRRVILLIDDEEPDDWLGDDGTEVECSSDIIPAPPTSSSLGTHQGCFHMESYECLPRI